MRSLGNERVLRRAIILDSILHFISLRPKQDVKIQIKIKMNDDLSQTRMTPTLNDRHRFGRGR